MASNTPNLNLLKKDPVTDGNDTFNIETMLNENWDKIDADKKSQDDAITALGEAIGNIQIPVTSVNEKTGDVTLTAEDVGAETPSGAESKANSAASAALGTAKQYTDQVAGTLSTQMADLTQELNTHKSELNKKITKPASAVANNIAIFNGDKNIIDSGKKLIDFLEGLNSVFVVGYYYGNEVASRIINVGFTPSAVLLFGDGGSTVTYYDNGGKAHGGLALSSRPAKYNIDGTSDGTALRIVENGFEVFYNASKSTYTNAKKYYNYIAFK